MGWLLWSIYNDAHLGGRPLLKGGNCLRKVYFSDTRFSDDLDFTALQLDTESVCRARLLDVVSRVQASCVIQFERDRTIVDERETPDRESKARRTSLLSRLRRRLECHDANQV
jgi:predicted nucleotidyltransferase component of viral defense system